MEPQGEPTDVVDVKILSLPLRVLERLKDHAVSNGLARTDAGACRYALVERYKQLMKVPAEDHLL